MADTRLKIAVFIDFDNIEIGVKNTLNTQFDIGVVLEALRERGDVVSKIAYSDWSRAGDYSRTLTQHATKLVQRNLTPGGDKNGADINLALDALEMAFTHPHINAYVIVGGDSDFITLVEKLKQYDKQIFVVGGRSFTSYVMQRNCHEFIAYENLIGSSKRQSSDRGGRATGGGAQAPIEQVVPLVRRALKILSDREVSPQLGLLKSTLLQLDSTFSERTYGVSSFRDFADKLAAAGQVTVREMGRNVVVELTESGASADDQVAQTSAPQQAADGPAAPAAPAAAGGHRGQGRRGEHHAPASPAAPAQEPRTAEAVAEVRRLFQSAQQPPRWPMYVRQAKQFMRNVDSTFDERKYGFASIVDLLRACQREGLFRIERDRQGVMRLFQGNVMQAADGSTPAEQPAASASPRAPRPWQPGDDIPDIHDSDRVTEPSNEVVEGDVVREIETPEILDAEPAGEPDEEPGQAVAEEPKKGRGRATRAKTAPREPKAAKAPRAKKTAAAKAPRAAKSRARKAE